MACRSFTNETSLRGETTRTLPWALFIDEGERRVVASF
jgi:hypothetical protein